jgi:hypothetical protein
MYHFQIPLVPFLEVAKWVFFWTAAVSTIATAIYLFTAKYRKLADGIYTAVVIFPRLVVADLALWVACAALFILRAVLV